MLFSNNLPDGDYENIEVRADDDAHSYCVHCRAQDMDVF